MKKNMSVVDRSIRIIAAAIIAILYFTNNISGTLAYILLAFAGIFFLTSLAGVCPLYSLFGISTCLANKTKANN